MSEKKCSNKGDQSQSVLPGKYLLVGWGVDTTGLRLIDEIYQIAAYTPTRDYSQFIMPFGDLTVSCQRKHHIRIFNKGKYRTFKDIRTNTFIKSKSDVSALTDFVVWLEKIREDANNDGIILIYHEIRKISPWILLEVLRKYNLVERFQKVVKGFANTFDIAQAKCENSTKSLRFMSKVLLTREYKDFSSAVDRAKVSYEIATHLAQRETQKPNSETEAEIIEFVRPFVKTILLEEDEIIEFKALLERQNSFRPVFGALLRGNWSQGKHLSHLRRLLAVNNINYKKLKIAYNNNGKEGLRKVLDGIENARKTELHELMNIFDCFFDPQKKPVHPTPRFDQQTPRGTKKLSSKDKDSKSKSSPRALADNATGESEKEEQ